MNVMLAAAGWNFKKMMEKLKKEFFVPVFLRVIFEYFIAKLFVKPNNEGLIVSF